MSSPSSSSLPMSTADRQKAIQAILRDSSLSESEKRKQILDLNKPSTTSSNEQEATAAASIDHPSPSVAAAAAKSSPDSDDDDEDDDMALAKARARKPAAAAAAAAATTSPTPSSNLPQDAALAKARAQNHMGRATAPGVQAIGATATGSAYAAAAANHHDDDDDEDDDDEKDSKQQMLQEDPALAKARAFGGGGAAQGTAVGARAMSNNNNSGADDPALAKMRAFGGGNNVARGATAAAKGSSKHDDDDDEEEEDDIQDEDAALAKARGRKPSSPEIKTAPGANAVTSNAYDATIAKARGESASAQGSAVVEDHQDSAATALEKKLETNGMIDVVHQPLLSQYQKEDALKDAINDESNTKKTANGIDGGGSGRRLRKGGGIIAHEDDDDDIIDIVDKDEKKSLMHDSYYGDGYDAPIEATARPGYGVGTYLVQEQNASAAPQGNGDAVHVVHQDMGGTSDDVYADSTATSQLYGGVGAVLADDGVPPATTADASPALAAEAVTYAMDVKEIIPEAEVQKKEKRNIYRKWLVIAILTVCLVVPATVTAVVLGMSKQRRNNEAVGNGSTADEPPSTMAPTSANHQRYQTRLIDLGISSQEAMSNPLSAQNQALRWMTSVDGLALSLEEATTEEEQLLFIQRYTMATLYYSTNGDSWAQCHKDDVQTHCMDGRKNVWLSDTSECDWAGVGCNGNGMVSMISILYPLNMNGPLPQEMASLQSLNDLSIVTQQISGPLPTWIGKLSNLLTVRLYENRMIGALPSSLFTLPYLRNLVLRNNEFTGTINTAIGNMTSLISLHLSNNLLSGPIPDSISNLSNLKELYLYGNELNGSLPSSLYNMSNVEEIVLAYNFLTDELSPSVSKWDSLKKLNLRNNQFNGDIPKELGFLLKLEQLDLVENNFVGEMPKELCYLRDFKLQILAADCSGSTPEIMCTCCTSCERRRQLQQLRSGFLR